jgi:hypothetical protein
MATERHRKKLIEVSLPLEAINEACVEEKFIRTGHPANLHQWWSRKPLAAARADLFAGKAWAYEALAYIILVVVWPRLKDLVNRKKEFNQEGLL